MMRLRRVAGPLVLALALSMTAHAATPLPWPDTPAARAAAEARIIRLQQLLESEPSATLVLRQWCETYHLATDPRIIAKAVRGAPQPPPASVRHNLALKPGEAVGYRRVQLLCGDHILSDAENWYVPDRLTPAMNAMLDHSDTPFGLAVRSLHFTRRTLSSARLWSPASAGSGDMAVPDHVLRNEGLLMIDGDVPIAHVIENYTAAILGAAP